MCKCTPNIRTPWCGKIGCEIPKQSLNLVRDNSLRLADEFVERLNYLKHYFEDRYKPLTFVYKVEDIQGRIRILCRLSGNTKKIESVQYHSPSAAAQYNFDIVQKYCEEIQKEIEYKIVEEGINAMK